MFDTREKSARGMRKRVWSLWGGAFALLVAMAATVHLLYLRLLLYAPQSPGSGPWLRNGYYTGVGLIGLVLLFIFYTISKQMNLQRLQDSLARDQRDLEDLRARLSEITTLFQVATAINLELSLDVVLTIIVRRVVGALKAQQSSIMLYDSRTDMLKTRAYFGVEGEFALNGSRRLGEGIAGRVAQNKEAVLLNDEAPDPDLGRFYKTHRHISSALSVPIRVEDKVIGVLNVNRINDPRRFTRKQCDLLRLFAEHVGTVIQRAKESEELRKHTEELEQTNSNLTELNRMKDMFLSTASHELKTPLTSVIAYAELLNDHNDRLSADERSDFLGRLRGEAERLLGLINDILDLTRLETGKIQLDKKILPLDGIAHSAVETALPMADEAQVTIEETVDADATQVEADEVKMRQAVLNLIVNAVKFSPSGGRVLVRTLRNDDGVRVEVTDNGPGVAPEEISRIFTLFGQGLSKSAHGPGGLGIGLHLVKRVTEMHDGTVGVKSRPGQGSTFWIQIPHREPEEDAAIQAA